MNLALWPIVARTQLVRAFRPGEAATRESPFRTLRAHGWATAGVSIVTRDEHRASGRFTIFSVLNVDAARSAREGDGSTARKLAKAAAKLEKSAAFARLKQLLSGRAIADVNAAVEGGNVKPELFEALRRVARETRNAQVHHVTRGETQVVTGTILEALRDGLVLQAETGAKTLVPIWLARSAHRANVGDQLALITDRLDDNQMVVNALPAIDLRVRGGPYSPFERRAVYELTEADEELLRGEPAALKILVPVKIES